MNMEYYYYYSKEEAEMACLGEIGEIGEKYDEQLQSLPPFIYGRNRCPVGVVVKTANGKAVGFCPEKRYTVFENTIGLKEGGFFVDNDIQRSFYLIDEDALNYKIKDDYEVYLDVDKIKNNIITREDIIKRTAKKRSHEEQNKVDQKVEEEEKERREIETRERQQKIQELYEKESVYKSINKNIICDQFSKIIVEKNINEIFSYDEITKMFPFGSLYLRETMYSLSKKKVNFEVFTEERHLKIAFRKPGISINGAELTKKNIKTVFKYALDEELSKHELQVLNRHGVGYFRATQLKNLLVNDFKIPIQIGMMENGLFKIKMLGKEAISRHVLYVDPHLNIGPGKTYKIPPDRFVKMIDNMGWKRQEIYDELKNYRKQCGQWTPDS